ncbi:cyclic nucleotide-binding protein [Syntrophotalea carbinolica DSM 2380]|uniref:Cyclic nucleotide-binding protein n=1 Tax=Syntrophotalea carbinolica (strain DSM 2380 / NBRC 103641 / GraBd1) TaxID=338963 RepID=Q3A7D2_SYNC1|nr:cyclic nucleotide-binding domain-containing protein [Syntrophotalea carbinolica]ABA87712.1 cyclic nucleotide-binding protein [Syntrophotalea carbinolica DSM 2380]
MSTGRLSGAAEGLPSDAQKCLEDLHIFNAEELAALLPYLGERKIAAGETLWHEGQAGSYLSLILSGHLEAKKDTEFPGKQVVVAVFGPGAVVGELSFLDQSPRAVSVVAMEDARLAVIGRDEFGKLLADFPEVGMKLYRAILLALASRLKKSYERLAAIF